MKLRRQLECVFFVFTLVLSVLAVPTTTYAADSVKSSLTAVVNYITEEIEVTKKKEMQTIYYTDKYNGEKTVWEEAYIESDTKASIDFSYASSSKGLTISVTEDTKKEPVAVTVEARLNRFGASLSGTVVTGDGGSIVANDWTAINKLMTCISDVNKWEYGFLCFYIGKGSKTVPLTASNVSQYVQYKKGVTGEWHSILDLNLNKYAAKGATLYFRVRPVNNVASSGELELGRASKEVRIKYVKQANAPKISINGSDKKISLAKTMEYRVSINGKQFGEWVKVADAHMTGTRVNIIYLKDLKTAVSGPIWAYSENNADQKIQVRVAATAKKIPSKITTISLNAATTPSVDAKAGIEFTLVKATTLDQGIMVTNHASGVASTIEVAVIPGETTNLTSRTVKWTTIKAGKSAVIKKSVIDKGDRIVYRTSSIKDDVKTTANEFTVSSEVGTLLKKDFPTPLSQLLTLSNASATYEKTQPSAMIQASIEASGSGYKLIVAKPALESEVTVTIDAAVVNIADQAAVKATASGANHSGISVSGAKIKDGKTTLTITFSTKVAAGTSQWVIAIDDMKKDFTIEYK